MKKLFTVFALFIFFNANSQSLYFPPIVGTTWDTISPASLGWCQDKIDTLPEYLGNRNTKAFIILKDGKIAVEHYFGTFLSWHKEKRNKFRKRHPSVTYDLHPYLFEISRYTKLHCS